MYIDFHNANDILWNRAFQINKNKILVLFNDIPNDILALNNYVSL